MAKMIIEKSEDKYTLSFDKVTNNEIGELIGFAQLQAGLRFTQLGMDAEDVKSALLEICMAACEAIDDQAAKRRMAEQEKMKKDYAEAKKKKQKRQLDAGKIMALHNAGWSNADIAKEMETLEGQIDYIIRKEKKDEKDGV